MMSFGESVRVVLFEKYATFKGRASRSEYWWWYLFFVLIQSILNAAGLDVLSRVFVVAVLIPHIAVAVRRFHDIGLSGLWAFIYYISLPLFLFIVLPLDYWQMLWMLTPDQAYTQLGLEMDGMLLSFLRFWLFVSFLLVVLFCLRGTPGTNRYGTDPLR